MIGFELEAQVLSVSVLYGVDMKWLNSAVVLICKLQICRGALMHALAAGLAWAWSMSLFRKAQPPHSLPSPTQFMVILPTIPNAKLSQEKSWFIHICIYVYYITDIVRLVRIFEGQWCFTSLDNPLSNQLHGLRLATLELRDIDGPFFSGLSWKGFLGRLQKGLSH